MGSEGHGFDSCAGARFPSTLPEKIHVSRTPPEKVDLHGEHLQHRPWDLRVMGSILALGLQGSRKSVLQEVKAAEGWGSMTATLHQARIQVVSHCKSNIFFPPGGKQSKVLVNCSDQDFGIFSPSACSSSACRLWPSGWGTSLCVLSVGGFDSHCCACVV